MTTYISILRGINVAGQRSMKMDDLKKTCTELGFSAIKTYIQSGNLIFKSENKNPKEISQTLQNSIKMVFGFDVPVITLSMDDLAEIINNNPFAKDPSKDPGFFHITFLSENAKVQDAEKLNPIDLQENLYHFSPKAIYLYCPKGYSNCKLSNTLIEHRLKNTATTRNWKSCQAIDQLAKK